MDIEDILEALEELDIDHYLIIKEDGETFGFRPSNQSRESSINMLKKILSLEQKTDPTVFTVESIQ